ncbi:hypothetical protein CKA32_006678 [Geitlerinema sp. FC II]|nr:DUF565 domain-containing protein [Geitlerinema sp. CS-897]PPT10675.1 hypothetical protein CKA32_006678 [Geitlerinema sp. FC II]
MQNTRLNGLFDAALERLRQWLSNPWRRISVLTIGWLFGFFLGTAVSTIAGQRALLDITVSLLLLLGTEAINWLVYARRRSTPSTLVDTLSATKIGLVYSLFVEAFKLGS